jgi:hypothetical protein
METIILNGKTYQEVISDDSKKVIVRTYSAGVHYGELKSRNGKEVELINSRRIWYWDGAASLSQMAVDGVNKPNDCKFSVAVPYIILTEAIEIIPCTADAIKSIEGVPVWKK